MFLLDSEEIAFPDPALYDFEGGLLAMAEIYLQKESGLLIKRDFPVV